MVTVRGVVDRVGPTLLRITVPAEQAPPVTDVVIAEAGGRTAVAAGDLVLGVSVAGTAEAVALIRHAGSADAAAVLLKPPLAAQQSVCRAARAAGTVVVEVHQETAWAQLVWLLRTVLDAAVDESERDPASGDEVGGLGDLFRLADAVASVVDAPVTIEDTNSRVLAYSARQDLTDPARVATVMGRRIPDDVLAKFRSRGVFRELSRGRRAIFVPAQPDGTLPRLIVPIRMGGELLGSMWAVVTEQVPEERAAAFADAGPVVGLHLLRRRARTDAKRRRDADVLRGLLDGSASPRLAAAELELDARRYRVVAVDPAGPEPLNPADAEGALLAMTERIGSGIGPRGIGRRPVTELHGLLFTVLPDGEGGADWPALRDALAGADGRAEHGPLLAAGDPAELGELSRSRSEAEEAMGLLRAGLLPGRAASHDQVWVTLVLHRAATAASGAGVSDLGPLRVLRESDASAHTSYLDTLYEWLRHAGDPRAASAALRIHPNTLRYRLRRLVEVAGIELADPDTRLALLVQLTASRWH